MKIAFIGLGNMGAAMARNLLKAGHSVAAYNRTPAKAQALVADGAEIATSIAEAAQNADIVWTMLPDDNALSEVVFGAGGVASALDDKAAHISSSTISVRLARQLAESHAAQTQNFVSAPVFGRPDAAENKRLLVVAAGRDDLLQTCTPLFEAIGRQTFIAGSEPWQANAIKLCGNFMIASMMETFGEAFALLRKAGVEHHAFLDIMNELFGSPVYKNYGGIIADEKFEPAAFPLKLGLKDVRLALEAAADFEAPMPFASILRDHFLTALAHGQGTLDWSSVAKVSARASGLG